MTNTLPERFWSKVDRRSDSECWTWLAGKYASGYGAFRMSGRSQSAHRLSYEALVGPIPSGLVIDHLCRNRACVNPSHMEPVTIAINALRGVGAPALHALKTQCSSGHEFNPENTRVNKHAARVCKTCEKAWQAAYYRRKKVRTK